ncbi:hypothetical protein R3W88_014640 [Solanum pinnatisectum]|uniref:RNase H type-1 domain-containing protein n=1 Tax=Solanum pinnatisectum TaxID=50273 RepID=A0AAV9KSB9_9SOLN|nr:hypothetical protein R3W88_014640 [Solanum pinnatisectum]
MARVKHLVILDSFKLLQIKFPYIHWPLGWNKICTLLERCTHDIQVTAIQWQKPPDSWVKINTDGSALNNPGRIEAGGILRNQNGELILAFSVPLGQGTNNQAEIEAANFGLAWCMQLNYRNVILEVDSQLLADWFNSRAAVPWTILTQL